MRDLLSLNLKRVQNLFRMDLHRMLHGKAFYVMVCIAVFIPVMMLTQMSDVRDITMFIGSDVVSGGSFGAGMNLSMLNILTGMLLSIYIGKEYTTGFIKNIITAHANKYDYLVSKGLIALICNIVFMAVYMITLFVIGAVMGLPAEIPSIIGMVLYIVEKLLLSIPMSMLMVAINLVFRRSYGWSIVFICIAATGIIVMSIQMGLRILGLGVLANVFNFTITGASAFTTTTPNVVSLLIVILVSIAWTLICSLIADYLMNKRDVL